MHRRQAIRSTNAGLCVCVGAAVLPSSGLVPKRAALPHFNRSSSRRNLTFRAYIGPDIENCRLFSVGGERGRDPGGKEKKKVLQNFFSTTIKLMLTLSFYHHIY